MDIKNYYFEYSNMGAGVFVHDLDMFKVISKNAFLK